MVICSCINAHMHLHARDHSMHHEYVITSFTENRPILIALTPLTTKFPSNTTQKLPLSKQIHEAKPQSKLNAAQLSPKGNSTSPCPDLAPRPNSPTSSSPRSSDWPRPEAPLNVIMHRHHYYSVQPQSHRYTDILPITSCIPRKNPQQ